MSLHDNDAEFILHALQLAFPDFDPRDALARLLEEHAANAPCLPAVINGHVIVASIRTPADRMTRPGRFVVLAHEDSFITAWVADGATNWDLGRYGFTIREAITDMVSRAETELTRVQRRLEAGEHVDFLRTA